MRNWECFVKVVYVCSGDRFSGNSWECYNDQKKQLCNLGRSIQVYDYILHLQGF